MKNKRQIPAWLVLTIISVVAAFGLAITNMATKDIIAARAIEEKNQSMKSLVSEAEEFKPLKLIENSKLDSLDEAVAGNDIKGYIAQITKNGYGGPMQIIVAVDKDFNIKGISVGGPEFAETAGLGTFVKEKKFTDQYIGKPAPLTLNKDIDQVSGATISSTAVNNGVNEAVEEMKNIITQK